MKNRDPLYVVRIIIVFVLGSILSYMTLVYVSKGEWHRACSFALLIFLAVWYVAGCIRADAS